MTTPNNISTETFLPWKELFQTYSYPYQQDEINRNVLWLSGTITNESANLFVRHFLHICHHNTEKKPITVYIDSTGGSFEAGMYIYEVLKKSPFEIITIGLQHVYHIAAIIFLAGDRRGGNKYTEFVFSGPSLPSSDVFDQLTQEQQEIIIKSRKIHIEDIGHIFQQSTSCDIHQIPHFDHDKTYYSFYHALETNIITMDYQTSLDYMFTID